MSVSTSLAESTLDRLSLAWEGDDVTVNAVPTVPEKVTGFGPFESYTSVVWLSARATRSPASCALFVFRKANRAPQESTIEFNKTGTQQVILIRFNILPDTSISTVRQRYGQAFDQQ